jgi:hypothetical protein
MVVEMRSSGEDNGVGPTQEAEELCRLPHAANVESRQRHPADVSSSEHLVGSHTQAIAHGVIAEVSTVEVANDRDPIRRVNLLRVHEIPRVQKIVTSWHCDDPDGDPERSARWLPSMSAAGRSGEPKPSHEALRVATIFCRIGLWLQIDLRYGIFPT